MKTNQLLVAAGLGLSALVAAHPVRAASPCGGPGQRACCSTQPCQPGLTNVPGCTGDCECSISVCLPHTPCGGDGQRGCCAFERADARSCAQGLVEYQGCSGDCRCGGLSAVASNVTCGLPEPPLAAEPGTDARAVSARACALSGFADLHMHLHTDLAHGGNVFSGQPAPVNAQGELELSSSYDVNTALSRHDDFLRHGLHGFGADGDPDPNRLDIDNIGEGTKDPAQFPLAAPYFSSWPTFGSTTHQQVYYKWLERAWQGGLRLTVQLAITNEALCRATHPQADWATCADSMASIDRQLDATQRFQAFIDDLCRRGLTSCVGGEGWFRVVRTPLEARQVIGRGQLAVVLGIEVDNLFNCKETGPCPNMRDAAGELIRNDRGEPIDSIHRAVDYYYRVKGVRHVFPVHNFDNAFGAAATWQDAIAAGNAASEGRWWALEECADEGYGFWVDLAEAGFLASFLGVDFLSEPWTAWQPSCNRYGLKRHGSGGELIRSLMSHGMLIDVDHMSRHSLDETIDMARSQFSNAYPLVAGHVQPFEIHDQFLPATQFGRHERMRTETQLRQIREDGGMIALMTKEDGQDTDAIYAKYAHAQSSPRYGAAVADDCRRSSKSFAQAYEYAVDKMGAPVALGTDFNGIAGHIGPRFGYEGCGRQVPEQRAQLLTGGKVQYPFELPGFGSFDRQTTGYKVFDYNVDGLAHVGLLPDMVQDLKTIGLGQTYIDALFRSAEWYVRTWERAEAVAAGRPLPTYPDPSAPSCDGVPLCLDETNQPPPISCPPPSVAECVAGGANVQYPDPQVGPDDCGDTSFTCGPPQAGDFFPLGASAVGCIATDVFGKQNGCSLSVQVVDTQAPSATAPDDLGGIECASHAGTAIDVGTGSASDVCEASPWLDNDAPALFPYGTTQVNWTASDSSGNAGYDAQLVTVVDTRPPSITCPERVTAECTGAHSAVAAPGSASGSDVCDASLDYTQYGSRVFPLGDTELPYTATDDAGLSASCTGLVSIVDTTPPVIRSVVPTPAVIRPPNHRMVSVSVAVDAFDVCDAGVRAPLCAITDIESSEPEDGEGDGNTWMDWEITGALSANLRAERSGRGPGRTYTVEVTCADLAGFTTTATATVAVPH